MKNLFLLFSVIFLSYQSIHAQNQVVTDSMPVSFANQVANLFEHVDLSEVTNSNGLLYEHGFPLYTIDPFNGTLTDSSKTSMLSFSLLYATVYSMA